MNKKSLKILALNLCILFSCISASAVTDDERVMSTAKHWVRMFSKLKPTNKITVAVVSYEHLYEIKNVTGMTADGRFLLLRYKGEGNRDYTTIVYAGNVLLIREGQPQAQ